MSEQTTISWCHSTWSPWLGCRRVSPGCVNCYIEFSTPIRVRGLKHGQPRQRTGEDYWKQPLKWNRDAFAFTCGDCDPCIGGRPDQCAVSPSPRPRIFPSLCDWLDEEVPIEWLADFLKLIHDTPNLDWLLLTKRPELFEKRVGLAFAEFQDNPYHNFCYRWFDGKPPHNVWIGVSVEDQKRADERIPLLLQIPAKVRFLSVEPLLGKVDLAYTCFNGADSFGKLPGIDWVIVGGESGSNRRDRGVEAICDVARQCVAAGVPCHVKQDSAFKPGQRGRIPDDIWKLKELPNHLPLSIKSENLSKSC